VTEETPRPPRRKRYSGKNPRKFEDKYKEHDPARFADTVAKVIASGKTPAGSHIPIMVAECLDSLQLSPGLCGVDATLGYGGHSLAILKAIAPAGTLLALDVDPLELPKTVARIHENGFCEEQFRAYRSNYAGVARAMAEHQLDAVDFIFADLGCSSMQVDDPTRGFSFKTRGPLDMRMNPHRGLSAADWLVKINAQKLAIALHQNADEPRAESISEAIAGKHYADTISLAQGIRDCLHISDEEEREQTVRRVFQAIRIAVNEEFHALDAFLRALPTCLKPAGRVAILTFHSGEDRRVKQAFKLGLQDGSYAQICETPITASAEERRANPRSTSAKLRWAVRS